jgi:hypothetical protein
MLVLVRLAQVLGDEVLMWIVAMGLGCVFVLVRVLVPEVLKPSHPLDEVVRHVIMRMLVPDGFVLMFSPTRLPSSHKSSSARPSSCRRTDGWSGPNPSHARFCRGIDQPPEGPTGRLPIGVRWADWHLHIKPSRKSFTSA